MNIEFIFIKDNLTGETLHILKQPLATSYIVTATNCKVEKIPRRSIGKKIRKWMKKIKLSGEIPRGV